MENGSILFRNNQTKAIGLHRLVEEMGLRIPLPVWRSEAVAGVTGARPPYETRTNVLKQYPASYAPKGIWGHLRFAMRYEPIDLGVLAAFFRAIDQRQLETWVRGESTGIFARRAWYLFELLTGQILDLPDVPPTGYALLLRPETHVTAKGIHVQRQKIVDNLLGNREYCPLIRRSSDLVGWMQQDFQRMFDGVVSGVAPSVLERAVQYLFTKETQSSFAIEGETPSPDRTRRFVQALQNAGSFDSSSKGAYIELQKKIVDTRFALEDWRSVQNYVGSVAPDYSPIVHYVCPKPGDLSSLMDAWMRSVARIGTGEVNPVCAATIAGFGFVYLHPFEDGNGRLHRFLIHQSLAKLGFTPKGVLFPVSAAMLRNRYVYDQALELLSRKMQPFIDFRLDDKGRMTVSGETGLVYRYPDLTFQTEYLYQVVADTIETDMKMELGFLKRYDRAIEAADKIVEMPGFRASLLVRLILQNHGRLSKAKRGQFAELSDEEIAAIENAIHAIEAEEEVR
jgi:hypothetical protein